MNLYFNNAATSWPKPPSVIDAVRETLEQCTGNPGRSSDNRGLRLLFRTREAISRLFNIKDSSRIIFTCNATHAINMGLKGFLKQGNHVVTTAMEHNAVARPLHALEMSGLITCEVVPCSPVGQLDPQRLRSALQKQKTDLLVINHASNVDGSIQDLALLGSIAGEFGVPMMCDCSQSAGAVPLDVAECNISMMGVPGHKGLQGPTGTGFLYLSPDLELAPLICGGTGSFSEHLTQPETLPDRFESGTLNIHGLAGLKAGIDYILQRGITDIRRHELELIRRTQEGLNRIEDLTLYGPVNPEERLAVFSVTVAGCDVAELCNILESDHALSTRAGLQCSPRAHKTIGTFPGGTLRISPGLFHTTDDIDHMLHCVRMAIKEFQS